MCELWVHGGLIHVSIYTVGSKVGMHSGVQSLDINIHKYVYRSISRFSGCGSGSPPFYYGRALGFGLSIWNSRGFGSFKTPKVIFKIILVGWVRDWSPVFLNTGSALKILSVFEICHHSNTIIAHINWHVNINETKPDRKASRLHKQRYVVHYTSRNSDMSIWSFKNSYIDTSRLFGFCNYLARISIYLRDYDNSKLP